MTITAIIVGVAAACSISLLAILPIRRYAVSLGLLDAPNERSSHRVATPRGGGIAMILAAGIGLMVLDRISNLAAGAWALFALSAFIGAVGFFDDRHNLSPALRLVAHVSAAALLVYGFGTLTTLPLPRPLNVSLPGPVAASAFSILWIVAVLNFFNFMDGIDGLAAGQAVATCVGVLIAAWSDDAMALAAVAGGACIGFLFYNWPPARIFMGDTGSGFLGFMIAGLPFLAPADRRGDAALALATGLALFLLDPLVTLFRRQLAGKNILRAHREHLYQQLVGPTESARRITTAYTCTGLILALIGAAAYRTPALAWFGVVAATGAFATVWRLATSTSRARR